MILKMNSTQSRYNKRTKRILLIVSIILLSAGVFFGYANIFNSSPKWEGDSSESMVHRGKGIYLSIFLICFPSDEMKVKLQHWEHPSPSRYPTSTDYFLDLVTNELINEPWNYFSRSGVKPETGELWNAENNMWSVVADLTGEDPDAPFLVSRNLAEPALIPSVETTNPPRVDLSVFKRKSVVVIRSGGSAEIIPIKDLTWERLNPTGLSNLILHPEGPVATSAAQTNDP